MATRTTRTVLLLLLLSSPAATSAQAPPAPTPGLAEQSLEELMTIKVDTVSGASKREQLVTEAPSSVTVVTAQEIAAYGWRTLGEALRATRSFYVTYDRNYSYLGTRGFGRPTDYNNRVLVLVNGHRVNDNVYDAVSVGADFPIDLALVERIEIIRGPGSALYGTSAFFAVIDVITRRGSGLAGGEGSLESASFNTWRSRGSFGASDDRGRDLLLSVSHLSSDGVGALRFPEYDDPVTGPGISRGADGERASTLFASARVGHFSFEGVTSEREKHLATGAWGTALSEPGSATVDRRAWVGATWRSEWKRASVIARAFYDHMRYEGTYVPEDDDGYTEYAGGDWLVGEVTVSRVLGVRHRLTAGSEYREHLRQLQLIDPGSGMTENSQRSRQLALYVQDDVRLTDGISAVVGARADYWTLDGWSAHPRVGLIVQPDVDTSVKLLYGSAYRAPNAYERFYTQGTAVANPLIRPERLRTGELVVERYVGGRLRLTGAAYVTQITGLVSQHGQVDERTWYDNGPRVHATGVEVEAERRWTNGVVARGSVAKQRAHEANSDAPLSNSPGVLGTLRLEAPLVTRRATIALDWQHVSSRLTDRGATAAAYSVANVTWRYAPRQMRGGAVALSVYNLFDTAYAHPVGAEFRQDVLGQDGRTIAVRATLGF